MKSIDHTKQKKQKSLKHDAPEGDEKKADKVDITKTLEQNNGKNDARVVMPGEDITPAILPESEEETEDDEKNDK